MSGVSSRTTGGGVHEKDKFIRQPSGRSIRPSPQMSTDVRQTSTGIQQNADVQRTGADTRRSRSPNTRQTSSDAPLVSTDALPITSDMWLATTDTRSSSPSKSVARTDVPLTKGGSAKGKPASAETRHASAGVRPASADTRRSTSPSTQQTSSDALLVSMDALPISSDMRTANTDIRSSSPSKSVVRMGVPPPKSANAKRKPATADVRPTKATLRPATVDLRQKTVVDLRPMSMGIRAMSATVVKPVGPEARKSHPDDRLPEAGEVVLSDKQTFLLAEVIGSGGYGKVFRVTSSIGLRSMALKAEVFSKSILKNELQVLTSAAGRHCTHICELFDFGRVENHFKYIVMTLLGPDLYKLRRDRIAQCFTFGTTMRTAMETLRAIEELHICGFVSRDIKPSNFAIGNVAEKLARRIFIFDFGLSKRYLKDDVVIPSKGTTGWRGTARYGSLRAHNRLDQGRKDDVESWLYMIVEFHTGYLPWRYTRDRNEVGSMKESARNVLRRRLLGKCPPEFDSFMTYVDELTFEKRPPYECFYADLDQAMRTKGVDQDGPYDWELPDVVTSTRSLSVSERERCQRSAQLMISDLPKVQLAQAPSSHVRPKK